MVEASGVSVISWDDSREAPSVLADLRPFYIALLKNTFRDDKYCYCSSSVSVILSISIFICFFFMFWELCPIISCICRPFWCAIFILPLPFYCMRVNFLSIYALCSNYKSSLLLSTCVSSLKAVKLFDVEFWLISKIFYKLLLFGAIPSYYYRLACISLMNYYLFSSVLYCFSWASCIRERYFLAILLIKISSLKSIFNMFWYLTKVLFFFGTSPATCWGWLCSFFFLSRSSLNFSFSSF